MRKEVDFAFIYEVKNRELDNVLLLKCELERRGYSVALIETWDQEYHRDPAVKAKVAVCFALYNDSTLKYMTRFVRGCRKFVNLQWEQIRTNSTEEASGDSRISIGIYGLPQKAVHICWGEHNYNKLTQSFGVSPDRAVITGSVTLDFLRKEFSGFYASRDRICKDFGLDASRKLYLFISSFGYADLPEAIINSPQYQNQGFDVAGFYKTSKESRSAILNWFEAELTKHPDTVIIYRPHPAEADAECLKAMEEKYANFRVIGDLSIKQWILIADKIFTWWSTAVAEVYAARKGCSILRPVSIPYEMEVQIYNGAVLISSFDEFDQSFDEEAAFPIPKENMERFYCMDEAEPAFIKVCNLLEKVIENDEYAIKELKNLPFVGTRRILYNLIQNLKRFILGNEKRFSFFQKILGERKIVNGETLAQMKNRYNYTEEMRRRNYTTTEEQADKESRLLQILENPDWAYLHGGQVSMEKSHRDRV